MKFHIGFVSNSSSQATIVLCPNSGLPRPSYEEVREALVSQHLRKPDQVDINRVLTTWDTLFSQNQISEFDAEFGAVKELIPSSLVLCSAESGPDNGSICVVRESKVLEVLSSAEFQAPTDSKPKVSTTEEDEEHHEPKRKKPKRR